MKRGNVETRHDVPKKPKIEPGGTNQTVVGRGHNIDQRHAQQLQSLISLIPSNKLPLQVTDERSEVLQQTGSCTGIYMEWLKKKDTYFLWGSNSEEGLMIKFEFHGGFKAEAGLLDVKNPLLAFSDGFNSGNWKDVKQILLKVFENNDEEKSQCGHDFLLAFTRTGEILHLRVFKILQLPSSPSKKQSMRLQCVSPVFVLKPLEIHRRDVGGGSEGYTLASKFFDENQFMFAESGNCFNLDQHMVYSGSSSELVAPHVLHEYNSLVVLLPLPASPSWIGFNTSCKEFFERYHTVREVPVPGKGPPSKLDTHVVYTCPMRVFIRSLIMELGEAFDMDCCFSDFTEDNVFLRGGKAGILGVKLVRYTERQARRNWKVIMNIMTARSSKMPDEVLTSPCKFIAAVSCEFLKMDPRAIYHTIVNSFGWMDPLDKHHLVADLYVEFLTFLDPAAQMAVARDFPDLKDWEKRFDGNRLLKSVRVNNLGKDCISDAAAYEAWKEDRANTLNASWKLKKEDAKELLNGRLYFGNVRHSYTHLPEHGLKAPTPLKLPPEQVDVIVSSALGDMGPTVQEKVPGAFPSNDPRRSQARFSRYFHCVNEFDSNDEK